MIKGLKCDYNQKFFYVSRSLVYRHYDGKCVDSCFISRSTRIQEHSSIFRIIQLFLKSVKPKKGEKND